jgi:hypothetical protein
VNATATAASTALPPSLKIRSAASALNSSATAIAEADRTGFAAAVLVFAHAGDAGAKLSETVAATNHPAMRAGIPIRRFVFIIEFSVVEFSRCARIR